MLKKNQIEILNLFRKNIFLKLSILQIKKKLKKKSYQRIYDAVKELEKNRTLNSEKIGNTNLISLMLTPNSISQLSFLDEQEAFSKKIPHIKKILGFKEFLDDIIIITGSYAKGKTTEKSDIDLVIMTKEKAFKKQKLLENLTSLFKPEIHPIVITYKDFIEMLLSEEENYGKEIFKNRLILRNLTRYYQLIKEAIKNGYRG